MPERRDVAPSIESGPVVYAYDGSFDGLLCCVFESYERREMPSDVLPDDGALPLLLRVKTIESDEERARRVLRAIPDSMGVRTLRFVRRAFLTCLPNKGLLILKFLRMGFRYGPSVMDRLTDETVHTLSVAVTQLNRETDHYAGFVRFSDSGGVLTAQIEPKNIILPMIARHFAARYPRERFLIYDRTNRMVLLHQGDMLRICGADGYEPPVPGAEELEFRALWRLFYDTIGIKERYNPRCRMTHMPKRYWRCMTEFMQTEKRSEALVPMSGSEGSEEIDKR
jgi:probable DNA metabolism protein